MDLLTSRKIENCWKSVISEVKQHQNLWWESCIGQEYQEYQGCQKNLTSLNLKQWLLHCRFPWYYIITDGPGNPICLFNVIIIDLIWVTRLLQSITGCFRSCKIIKKLLLHLDIGSHDDHSTKLFVGHKRCNNSQWLLTGRYFKCCYMYLWV